MMGLDTVFGIQPSLTGARAIDVLRSKVHGVWLYDYGHWNCELKDGRKLHVVRCAHFAPRFDGDDDNFVSRWHAYWDDGRHIAASASIDFLGEQIASRL
jgi:hypothetical protein